MKTNTEASQEGAETNSQIKYWYLSCGDIDVEGNRYDFFKGRRQNGTKTINPSIIYIFSGKIGVPCTCPLSH